MNIVNFPYPSLPKSIQYVVAEVQEQTQAPTDLVCMVALSVATLAVQYLVDVEGSDGSTTAVALNIMLAAEAGERDTAVFNRLLKSVIEFEAAKREQGREHVLRHKAEQQVWAAHVAGLKKRITREVAEGGARSNVAAAELVELTANEPVPPIICAPLFKSVTPAKLNRSLATRYPSAGIFSSEAADILRGDMLRLLVHHNSSWYGQTRSRETMDERIVARWDTRVTLLLMLQGDDFSRFIRNRGKMARNREFFARALIGEPILINRTRFINRAIMKIGSAEVFHARVRELLESAHNRIEGDCQRALMRPDVLARSQWISFNNHIELRSGSGGDLASEQEFASKIGEQALRIAAVLQFFDTGALVIDEAHMLSGIAIANYFLREHLRLFPHRPDLKVPDGQILLNHLYGWHLLRGETMWSLKKIESCAPGKLRGQNRRTRNTLELLVANHELLKVYPSDRKGLHFSLNLSPAGSAMPFQQTQLPQLPPMMITTPPTV